MPKDNDYSVERIAQDATIVYMTQDEDFVKSVDSRLKVYTSNSVRVTVHIDEEDYEFIEKWSKKLGLSRSSFTSLAIKELDSIWRREWWEAYCRKHPEVQEAIKKCEESVDNG